MISRLVLVGMVATLGISVPSWSELHRAMRAFHSWTASQLAEWDYSASKGRDEILMAPMLRDATVATVRGSGRLSPMPVRSFEPIPIEDRAADIALELNRRAEGLIVTPEEAGAGRRRREPAPPGTIARRQRTELIAEPLPDTLELRLAFEMMQTAERSQEGPAVAAVDRMEFPPRPEAAVSSRDATPARPTEPAIPAANRVATTAASSAPIDGGPSEFAARLDRSTGGSDIWPDNVFADPIAENSTAHARVTSTDTLPDNVFAGPAASPTFEPIETRVEVAFDAATGRNRAPDRPADGGPASQRVEHSAPAPPPVEAEPRGELGQAIRLTHDAIHAWMNVLTGPAVVHMSAR